MRAVPATYTPRERERIAGYSAAELAAHKRVTRHRNLNRAAALPDHLAAIDASMRGPVRVATIGCPLAGTAGAHTGCRS